MGLEEKLETGDESCSDQRPHSRLGSRSLYEILKEKMASWATVRRGRGRSQRQGAGTA